jgi:hypothetical protein
VQPYNFSVTAAITTSGGSLHLNLSCTDELKSKRHETHARDIPLSQICNRSALHGFPGKTAMDNCAPQL